MLHIPCLPTSKRLSWYELSGSLLAKVVEHFAVLQLVPFVEYLPAYVSIRQHTSAYVSTRQHAVLELEPFVEHLGVLVWGGTRCSMRTHV